MNVSYGCAQSEHPLGAMPVMRTWVSIRSFPSTTGKIPRRLGCVHARFTCRGTIERCGPKLPATGARRFLVSVCRAGRGAGGNAFRLPQMRGLSNFSGEKPRGSSGLCTPPDALADYRYGSCPTSGHASRSEAAKVSATLERRSRSSLFWSLATLAISFCMCGSARTSVPSVGSALSASP